MNAEFNWWLLIVGLVVGAGLVWLVVADTRRREVDVADTERAGEARWIAAAMTDAGRSVDDDDVLDILRLHAAYLGAAPPDPASDDAGDGSGVTAGAWPTAVQATPVTRPDEPRTVAADRRTMARPTAGDPTDHERGTV